MPAPTLPPLASAPSLPWPTPAGESSPFPDPLEPDSRLAAFLERAGDLLCRWLGSTAGGAPLPLLSVLPEVAPQAEGLSPERLLADLQHVMEGAFNPNHPGSLAHLDPPPLTASIVADLICAGLNNNLLAEELSPSLSHLERRLCAWLASRLGLPEGAGGVAASGGTLSNLMALVAARQARGLQSRNDAVVLCSEDAHVSLQKAVRVMGLPDAALQRLPVEAGGRLDLHALERRLQRLARQGVPVIAVVATAGTTVRGAVDPLGPLAALCRRHDHWLHVDGAIGAVFALASGHRHRVAGLDRADSITLNPQKLLGITKTSSLLLLADPAVLARCFRTGLPYMEPGRGGCHGGEAGLQGTRPAEILKLWLGLRQLGLGGVERLLDGAIGRRRQLQGLLAADPRLRLRGGSLHLLAFRPAGTAAHVCEEWSRTTRQELLRQQLMLSRPFYRGHHHLKAVLGNPHTGTPHLERLARCVTASLDDLPR
jgi:sulfinoalanine decarboxylase